MVPFDVVDVVSRQDRIYAFKEKIADLWQGHVECFLIAPKRLVIGAQRPIGVEAVTLAVGVDHLGFEPDAKAHAKPLDMVDQGTQSVGVFAGVDLPIGERARVIVALAKPAVVKDKTLRADGGGAGCDVLEYGQRVVEIHRFPAIVV